MAQAAERRSRRRLARVELPLLVVLAIYVIMVVAYSLATPMGEAPDETTHLEYVLYILRSHELPVIGLPPDLGPLQAKHPPLYYLAGAALTFWADTETLGFMPNPHFSYNLEKAPVATAFVHLDHEQFPYDQSEGFLAARIMRLVSLFAGLAVVWSTYRFGRLIWPAEQYLAWGPAAAVAFVPGFLFFSGVFNNDMGATAWSALALLASVRVALGHVSRRDFVLLGLAVGLGLVTKLTTLPSMGVAALAVLVYAYRSRQWRVLPSALLQIGAPVALTSGWWFVRNMRLYGINDPLALRRSLAIAGDLTRQVPLRDELGAYLRIQLTTFWARFGWATISLPREVYRGLLGLMALSVVGLLLLVLRGRRLDSDTRWGLALIGAAVSVMYLSVIQMALDVNLVVAHGRFVYVALAGLGVLFVTGLAQLFPARARPWAVLALDLGLLALAVVSLVGYMMPAFRRPTPLTPDEITAIPHVVNVDYDGRFRLVGYDLSSTRLVAGQALTVTLFWSALAASWEPFPPPVEGHIAFMHALDGSGKVVGRVDAMTFHGIYPPTGWTPGRVFRESYVVSISPTAVPGRAVLLVGLYGSEAPRARLAATRDGSRLGDAFRIEPLVIRPAAPVTVDLADQERRSDSFSEPGSNGAVGAIRLLGRRLEQDGGRLTVTLTWQSQAVVAADYTVFVHLVGPDGAPIAVADGPPQGGRYPTSLWEPGELVVDAHVIEMPGTIDMPTAIDAPAAGVGPVFRLRVGLYDPISGERLPAVGGDGSRWPDDAVDLGEVEMSGGGS